MTIKQVIVLLVACAILFVLWYVCDYLPKKKKSDADNDGPSVQDFLSALGDTPRYYDLAYILNNCVAAEYRACSLERPEDRIKLQAPMNSRATLNKSGQILFRYKFRRAIIGLGGGRIEYSTMPAEKMVENLNSSLPNYCRQYGYVPRGIVDKKDEDNGQVYFYVVAFNDKNEATDYLNNLEGFVI